MRETGLASPGMFDSIPSPAFRRSHTLFTSPFQTTGNAYPSSRLRISLSMAATVEIISSRLPAQNSTMSRAPGSPSMKNLFRFWLSTVAARLSMVLSISSTAHGWYCSAIRLARKASLRLCRWTHARAFTGGGSGTRPSFASVTMARVPSDPQMSLARLTFRPAPGVNGSL